MSVGIWIRASEPPSLRASGAVGIFWLSLSVAVAQQQLPKIPACNSASIKSHYYSGPNYTTVKPEGDQEPVCVIAPINLKFIGSTCQLDQDNGSGGIDGPHFCRFQPSDSEACEVGWAYTDLFIIQPFGSDKVKVCWYVKNMTGTCDITCQKGRWRYAMLYLNVAGQRKAGPSGKARHSR